MTSLFLTLLAPVLVLWIGATVFYVLDHLVQPQDAGVAEGVVLLLAIGALIWIAILPSADALQAELAFGEALGTAGWPGTPPTLRVDPPALVLALLLLVTAGRLALFAGRVWPASSPERNARVRTADGRVAGRAGRMAALGAALLFLFAGDWATMALAWVVGDLFLLYTRRRWPTEGEHSLRDKLDRRVEPDRRRLPGSGRRAAARRMERRRAPGHRAGPRGDRAAPAALSAACLAAALCPRYTLLARVFSFLVPTLLGAHLCSQLAPWVWRAELGIDGGAWLGTVRGTVLALWALRPCWSARSRPGLRASPVP